MRYYVYNGVRRPAVLEHCDAEKAVFEDLAARKRIKILDDWYQLKRKDVSAFKASIILSKYGDMQQTLSMLYPKHEWFAWKFAITPQGCLDDKYNQLLKVNDIARKTNVKVLEDWYTTTWQSFFDSGGGSILLKYNNSVQTLVTALYPDYNWLHWRFNYDDKKHRQALDNLSEKLNIATYEGWYYIKRTNIHHLGFAGSLVPYHKSKLPPLAQMIPEMYPEHDWEAGNFGKRRALVKLIKRVKSKKVKKVIIRAVKVKIKKVLKTKPSGYWLDLENLRSFLEIAKVKLNIKSPLDWYRVSKHQIRSIGGGGAALYWPRMLHTVYPETSWKTNILVNKNKRSSQRLLEERTREVLGPVDIYEEYKLGAKPAIDMRSVHLDLFVPALNLALEYHGEQHYGDYMGKYGPVSLQAHRDLEKQSICQQQGITLVSIPYWWDGSASQVAATIKRHRSDIKLYVEPSAQPLRDRETGHLMLDRIKSKLYHPQYTSVLIN